MRIINLNKKFVSLSQQKKWTQYRNLWRKVQNFEFLPDFPLHLDIELSAICNLKCEYCFQNGLLKTELGLMDSALFEKIIIEGVSKGLCAIKLQIRGESLLHPEIFELIKFAKVTGIMDIQLTTNATLLDDKMSDRILKSELDGIIFSVDSHHGVSFEQKKKNQFFYNNVEENIQKFLQKRNEKSIKRPWVRIRSSIKNFDQDSYSITKRYLQKKFPLADIFIIGRIQNFKNDEDAFPDLKINYTIKPCNYLTTRLAIFWNGDVTTCCADYNNYFRLGNISDMTIQEIWLSKKIQKFRSIHLSGKRHSMAICKHCQACIFPKSNNIAFDSTPRHITENI